jgi:acyl-coenzyme A thioesterase PaaI-like protein
MANSENTPQAVALGGFNKALNLSFVRANENEVVAELPITPDHHQPMGFVIGCV